MTGFTITIDAPELAKAIIALATALSRQPAAPETTAPVPAPAIPAAPAAPAPAPIPFPSVAPAASAAPAPAPAPAPAAAVPVSAAPTYTVDQLALAATGLVDAGKRQELVGLLRSFGAASLGVLPKDQYGAFAAGLRQLGAKI